MTKSLITTEMTKGLIDITKNASKKFDYTCTAIAYRLRTVSWRSYSQLTGVGNRFTGPTFPLPATAMFM